VKNIAAILYAVIFLYLVFVGGDRMALTERNINLVPFKSIGFLIDRILSNGSYKYYLNIVGNILLFVPLPFMLYYLSGVKN
jgi:glycopeptide antibiotics resistance protein